MIAVIIQGDEKIQVNRVLANWCNIHEWFIYSSAFNHPTRHLTTWEQQRTNKTTNQVIQTFTEIDFILCQQNQKRTLIDARSYAGTSVKGNHKLVVM